MTAWMICGFLCGALLLLLVRQWEFERGMGALMEQLRELLAEDTNVLLTVPSREPHLRKLAAELNRQLRVLRGQRQKYISGDLEVKNAVTNISHDLRTPLTAICGYLSLLEREEKSETVERYLAGIQNRVEAMTQLTEELFRYSLVTSQQALEPKRLDLVRLLEETMLSFYGAMESKKIQPELSLPEEPVWRELDEQAVNRIFSNLIGNAIKYSDGDLRVSMGENGEIRFENSASALTKVTAGKLFDRFYTVEASRNSSGLGLSIARTLTERMGGTIEAEFEDGYLTIVLCFSQK